MAPDDRLASARQTEVEARRGSPCFVVTGWAGNTPGGGPKQRAPGTFNAGSLPLPVGPWKLQFPTVWGKGELIPHRCALCNVSGSGVSWTGGTPHLGSCHFA
eukprot:EG_transcript_15575